MNSAAPTFSQIKAQVATIRQKIPDARVIGIHSPARWIGERYKQDGMETYLIEQCDSPLAMRIALREDVDPKTIKVLITSLDDKELSYDILLRLEKLKLFSLESWQIVKSLFQAHSIDPRLTQHRWIAEYLMERVPTDGYPPVSGGFLDAETVWSILLNYGLGLADEQPDLITILKWSIDAENVARYRKALPSFRETAADWLSIIGGPSVKAVLNCITANQQPDALPIGLAASVVFHSEVGNRLDKAIGKMEERYLSGTSPNEDVISRWSKSAVAVVQRLQLNDPIQKQQKQQLLQRADEILQEVGAEAFAYLSETSPLGFDQRLSAFGKCLIETLNHRVPKSLKHLVEKRGALLEHDRASSEPRRLERIDMAVRLARWLVQTSSSELSPPRSLAEAISYQLTEGSFLDWARLSLRSGDPVRELSEAYTSLFEQVTAIREKQSYQFAKFLQNWTEVGSTEKAVLPIEQILESVVAPLAKHAPILLIVIDGMSTSVCRELMLDITEKPDWVPLCREGQSSAVIAGLAAIPSITEVSRTSLLFGQLRRGNLTNEKVGFASHRALLAHCRSGFPPILFHKSSLQEKDNDVSLADDVRKTISSPQHRIVGVVVNAVDDHLLKGEQIDISWSCDEIKVLSTLLHEARLNQRLVVLLSDHGHVLNYNTKSRVHEGGERWRIDEVQVEKDELRISGSRVIIPESKTLIAPWTEKLRYGAKKNGYHGGLNPQEMVVPIAVLCSTGSYPTGWVEAPTDTPYWWEEPLQPSEKLQIPSHFKPINQQSYGPLFNSEGIEGQIISAQQVPTWVIALLDSPIYHTQKKLAGRLAPTDDILTEVLIALDSHDGKMTSTALTRTARYPATKMYGLLTVIQRVLNIDGYAVVTRDEASDTIELNRDLLWQQFNLSLP